MLFTYKQMALIIGCSSSCIYSHVKKYEIQETKIKGFSTLFFNLDQFNLLIELILPKKQQKFQIFESKMNEQ